MSDELIALAKAGRLAIGLVYRLAEGAVQGIGVEGMPTLVPQTHMEADGEVLLVGQMEAQGL